MAIQDDFTIDYVDRKITYTTAFVDDRPPSIYTVNELYSFLQDTFDEPAQMDDPVPMSAQTPTQYTFIYPWFIDDESIKGLYGGSIQTSGWTAAGTTGITALRWQDAPSNVPDAGEIGQVMTGAGGATGVFLAFDATRQVIWVRDTNATAWVAGENVTGTDTDFNIMANNGISSGDTVWANLFSVGSLQTETEIYIGQEDDELGGTAFHDADADSRFERRIEKIAEWWDSDVDFATGSPNLLGGAGHFDVLIRTQELGVAIDSSNLAVFARQQSKIYSHFELVGGVGNFVVPFASTGADLNANSGSYNIGFDTGSGGKGQLDIGDVIENDAATPVGRLRAVVTAVVGTTSGDFDFYLIGEDEADGTLRQLIENEDVKVRGDAFQFLIDATGTPLTSINGGLAQGITVTFADFQVDVDEAGGTEEYAGQIDCNSVALADVYERMQFYTNRGNQDGTVAATPDTLLPGGGATAEGSEFYRAVGDLVFAYDGGIGTQPTEGNLVTNGAGAYGVVVSTTPGVTGTMVLTATKGTWAEDDSVAEIDAAASNEVFINEPVTGPRAITDKTDAPFGSFAGGRWFVAQGIVLVNVPAADANNWETIDLTGTRRAPPASRTITFAGLIANDRVFLAEVDTVGGIDVTKNQNGVGAAGAAVSDTTIPLDSTVALDVPTSGMVRVVDDSSTIGEEYRFDYSAVSGTNVTLRASANFTGTCEVAGASPTVLVDTGDFSANFGDNGELKTGMMIRDTTTGAFATVLRRIDANSIETTVLSSGTWATTNGWEANQVVVALVDADTIYFPYIDAVATGTSVAVTIKFVSITESIARMRFSDPDIGGQRVLPFELTGVQITDANLTITAIRTDDTIAS